MRIEEEAYNKGYRCDSDGNIIGTKGSILKTQIQDPTKTVKYLSFGFRNNKKSFRCKVHKFVAYCKFKDLIYENKCVRHLDGNSFNNSWDNIELGTWSDNRMDIEASNRKRLAINATKSVTKYSKGLANKINLDRLNNNLTYRELGKKYNIPFNSIYNMINTYSYYG